MPLPPFNLFGSASSQDYDVLLYVDMLGTIHENHQQCKQYAQKLNMLFVEAGWLPKPINTNLAIVANGILTQVHKGTPDELNNAAFRTYPIHTQLHPLPIMHPVERDWQLKVIRACRSVLSQYTHTPLRGQIKQALRGNLDDKLTALAAFSLVDFDIFPDAAAVDVWKSVAFQLGQGAGLLAGVELYTKEEIADYYPDLNPFLVRNATKDHLLALEMQKERFIEQIISLRSQFTRLTET